MTRSRFVIALLAGASLLLGGLTVACDSAGDEPVFHDLPDLQFDVQRRDAVDEPSRVVEAVREEGGFRIRDTLRLQPGARYGIRVQSPSLNDDAYLTNVGPPATLVYHRSPPLQPVLTLQETGTMPVAALDASAAPSAADESGPSAKTSPAVPLDFEVVTADTTGVAGGLRLRLERSREGSAETEHVDFDVEMPARIEDVNSGAGSNEVRFGQTGSGNDSTQ